MSPQRRKVLDAYQEMADRGIVPTVRELGDACGLRSSSTVHAHLRGLRTLGYDIPTRGPVTLECDNVITSYARDLSRAVKRGIIAKTDVLNLHKKLKEQLK